MIRLFFCWMVITHDIILCALGQCMAVRAVVAPKDFADDVVFYILNVINFIITTWSTEMMHKIQPFFFQVVLKKIEYGSTLDKTLNQTICSVWKFYLKHTKFMSTFFLVYSFVIYSLVHCCTINPETRIRRV